VRRGFLGVTLSKKIYSVKKKEEEEEKSPPKRLLCVNIYISSKLSESCLEVVCAGIYFDLKN